MMNDDLKSKIENDKIRYSTFRQLEGISKLDLESIELGIQDELKREISLGIAPDEIQDAFVKLVDNPTPEIVASILSKLISSMSAGKKGSKRGKMLEQICLEEAKKVQNKYPDLIKKIKTQVKRPGFDEKFDLSIVLANNEEIFFTIQVNFWSGGHQGNRAGKYLSDKYKNVYHLIAEQLPYDTLQSSRPNNTQKALIPHLDFYFTQQILKK